jgi:hypothetical protein
MENLELQAQVINLGKIFITELGLETSTDTFSRWMAHYIAEKMTVAQQLPSGTEKAEAEKQCFETILKLWEHRWSLPRSLQPLSDFEPLLRALEKLNPENETPFFYNVSDYELSNAEAASGNLNEIKSYVTAASQIDKVARIWIEDILSSAASKAKSEKAKAILKNAVNLPQSTDIDIIRVAYDSNPFFDFDDDEEDESTVKPSDKKAETMEEFSRRYRLEKVKKRIEELEKFAELNKVLLERYNKELMSLKLQEGS